MVEAASSCALLSILSCDDMHSVLGRTGSVRAVLTFAAASKGSRALVREGGMAWARLICQRFIPAGMGVQQAHNLLELMCDQPDTFFPTAEEANALQWYNKDRTAMAPSNLYFYRVMSAHAEAMSEVYSRGGLCFADMMKLHK